MSIDDAEMVKEFLTESYENLDRLDRELVALEKEPQNRDALAGVFRTIHTIKGTCGFLGFAKLEKVAHVGENLLSLLRDGRLLLTPEIATVLLAMVDAIRQMLSEIQSTGQEGDADNTQLLADLTRLHASAATVASAAAANVPVVSPEPKHESFTNSEAAAPPLKIDEAPKPAMAAKPEPTSGGSASTAPSASATPPK